jgi:phage FluMu protein Com
MADVIKFDPNRKDQSLGELDVNCPRCGGAVFMNDNRCPHCKVWFQGKASQFSPNDIDKSPTMSGWIRWSFIAIGILIAIVILMAIFLP